MAEPTVSLAVLAFLLNHSPDWDLMGQPPAQAGGGDVILDLNTVVVTLTPFPPARWM